jgi:hypothetical protein
MLAVLGDDTLEPELAGVGEDGCPVALQMLAVADAGRRPRPPVLAIELEEIEGIEEHLIVIGPTVQPLEVRYAGSVAKDRLAVELPPKPTVAPQRPRRCADSAGSTRCRGG